MELHVLGSESAGNSYYLKSQDEVLLVEAGLRLQVVKQALDYDLSNVVGCLLSHVHGDHFKFHKDYAQAGITLYGNASCIGKYNGHRGQVLNPGKLYNIGKFKIIPFYVPHGVPCFGYLIHHAEMGKMLFVTDAAYIPNKFKGLNHICVETNYSEEAMVSDRAVGHHMSLHDAMQFLSSTDLSHCYNIILLHLSAGSSNAKQFISQVQGIAPLANVQVADKGLKVELSSKPF